MNILEEYREMKRKEQEQLLEHSQNKEVDGPSHLKIGSKVAIYSGAINEEPIISAVSDIRGTLFYTDEPSYRFKKRIKEMCDDGSIHEIYGKKYGGMTAVVLYEQHSDKDTNE